MRKNKGQRLLRNALTLAFTQRRNGWGETGFARILRQTYAGEVNTHPWDVFNGRLMVDLI